MIDDRWLMRHGCSPTQRYRGVLGRRKAVQRQIAVTRINAANLIQCSYRMYLAKVAYLSTYLPIYLPSYLSTYLHTYLPTYLPTPT